MNDDARRPRFDGIEHIEVLLLEDSEADALTVEVGQTYTIDAALKLTGSISGRVTLSTTGGDTTTSNVARLADQFALPE